MTKIFPLWLFIGLMMIAPLFGQTSTFDIATYVPPWGWRQSQSNGMLVIQDRRTIQGRVQFCQIYMFPSQPSNASPEVNFQSEWDAKVDRQLGLSARPSARPETTPSGWISLTDHVDVLRQGVPMRVILMTATGFGKFMSLMISVSPNCYQAELVSFIQNLYFHAPATGTSGTSPSAGVASPESPAGTSEPGAASASGSLATYVYTTPPAWTRRELPDRIVLQSPLYNNGEACQLTMLPLRPSSQPLDNEAIGAFRGIFQADPLGTYPSPPPTLARGKSPQGWEYFTIRKLVGGQEGEARTRGAILLVAKVNGQVAIIVGTSKDFMVSNCFGLLRGDLWPQFFYTLQFKNTSPSEQDHTTLQQRLAGRWIMATGSAGMQYTFQANGRYADTVATQYRTPIAGNQVLQTTTGFFGDGAYSFEGNMLVLKRDDNKRFTYFFRLEQVSKDSGRSWRDELALMEPGSSGEFSLRKE